MRGKNQCDVPASTMKQTVPTLTSVSGLHIVGLQVYITWIWFQNRVLGRIFGPKW